MPHHLHATADAQHRQLAFLGMRQQYTFRVIAFDTLANIIAAGEYDSSRLHDHQPSAKHIAQCIRHRHRDITSLVIAYGVEVTESMLKRGLNSEGEIR